MIRLDDISAFLYPDDVRVVFNKSRSILSDTSFVFDLLGYTKGNI
jgi:hypothetical protein